jgi:hypothetical protein
MGAPWGKRAVSGEWQVTLEAEGHDTAAGEGGDATGEVLEGTNERVREYSRVSGWMT